MSRIVGLTRVATSRNAKKAAVVLEVDGKRVQMSHGDMSIYNTAAAVEEIISTRAGLAGVVLPRVFVHINRDGSVAVATGKAPKVWPEDREEKELERFHG